MMRVVPDSNVYVSALLLGGNPRRVIDLAVDGSIELCISESISEEVERVLATKFHWPKERLDSATRYIWSSARWVRPQLTVTDCTDPDDNRVLECALEAQARSIVTGDHHLPVLHRTTKFIFSSPGSFSIPNHGRPRHEVLNCPRDRTARFKSEAAVPCPRLSWTPATTPLKRSSSFSGRRSATGTHRNPTGCADETRPQGPIARQFNLSFGSQNALLTHR
jgi:uncharacterized protein